jgi:hypothetical protein
MIQRGIAIRGIGGMMGTMACHARTAISLALVVSGVLAEVAAAQATATIGRTEYAAELHRINAPLLTLYDTFYAFTDGRRTVNWATTQTVEAQQQVRVEVQRLSRMTPPARVVRQHRRVVAALQRLRTDLQRPISLARKGRAAALGWWLQVYGALPEIKTLDDLHASLSRMGYWA